MIHDKELDTLIPLFDLFGGKYIYNNVSPQI
jgi:hypothetical protein